MSFGCQLFAMLKIMGHGVVHACHTQPHNLEAERFVLWAAQLTKQANSEGDRIAMLCRQQLLTSKFRGRCTRKHHSTDLVIPLMVVVVAQCCSQ